MPGSGAPSCCPGEAGSAGAMGIEPSCILTLRDELPDLVRDGRTKALAAASVTLEEFLASLPDYRPGRLERRAIVHGHCHQKALVGMEPTRQVLSKVEGLEFSILAADAAGWRAHSDTSRATTR
jgi:Fe-S oxidoreductase